MLTVGQDAEVRRLLREGRSQREINRLTHRARDTIARIAHDRRPDYEEIRAAKHEATNTRPSEPMTRCPGCGHRVQLPCRICRARQWRLLRPLWEGPGPVPELGEPLGLDLAPKQRRRYEQLRARRMRRQGKRRRSRRARPAAAPLVG